MLSFKPILLIAKKFLNGIKEASLILWAFLGLYVLLFWVLMMLWYAGKLQSTFVWFNDMAEWHGMDKLGHIYASFVIAKLLFYTLNSQKISKSYTMFVSVVLTWFAFLGFELADGFGVGYGFSFWDLLANTVGCFLFYLHEQKLPFWGNSFLLFSYRPTTEPLLNPNLLGAEWYAQILKNYNGQTYWLKFPCFKWHFQGTTCPLLCLSIGYSIERHIHATDTGGVALLLSFDIPLAELILLKYSTKKWVKVLQYIKQPLPAVELNFTHGIILHPFYW